MMSARPSQGGGKPSNLKQLQMLQFTMEQVFMAAESKNEMKSTLQKFASQIEHTSQQVSGTVTIEMPEMIDTIDDETALKNHELMEKYETFVEKWAVTIKQTIAREHNRKLDRNSALADIMLWRSRSANLSTLHQQLQNPSVAKVRQRLFVYQEDNPSTVMEFDNQMKELAKSQAEAKDNVKFLTTLERQFKNLDQEGLSGIYETLQSLMNGLKMVWIISRHYKEGDKMQNLLTLISEEIADKVEAHIKIPLVFQLKDDTPYEQQLEESAQLLQQGNNILSHWKNLFQITKTQMEDEGLDRWDFNVRTLKDRIEHMIKTLDGLIQINETLKKFLVFLGPNLKKVTGNSAEIDKRVQDVKMLVQPIVTSPYNFFQKQNANAWNQTVQKFNAQKTEIEKKTIELINETFKFLRSAEGAFDLLLNFKSIATLEDISKTLQNKYSEVLKQYTAELKQNEELFNQGKSVADVELITSKNKPPVAGSISWARSIFYRIKRPILKFISKDDAFDKNEFAEVKNKYKTLAKALDQYQKEKFDQWESNITDQALKFLKNKILIKGDGDCQYYVNFSEEFKVLIKEAKSLEKMGYKIKKTIVNISLQENEYYRYIDRLQIMLREYNEAVHTLQPIEKKLLEDQIRRLNRSMEPGHESLNLSSLGIPDFIDNCLRSINEFRDVKKKVRKSTGMIEDIVKSIEEVQILREYDFETRKENASLPQLSEFQNYFEEHLNKTIEELVEKYKLIGDNFLRNIEESILNTSTKSSRIMKEYYYYWERRVYNALVKMTLRAFLTYKNLLQQPKGTQVPLFQITAEYNHPHLNTIPPIPEVTAVLEKISNNIKMASDSFWRWMDGTCIFCPKQPSKGANEEVQRHTFFHQVIKNPIITAITMQIGIIRSKADDKINSFKDMWEDDKKRPLWDQKNKHAVEKIIDKNPSLQFLEGKMSQYRQLIQDFEEMPKERKAFFISEYFGNVIESFKAQAKDWMDKHGNVLKALGIKELELIRKEIEDYRESLRIVPKDIEELKKMLNLIQEIKNYTMTMEFKIGDVTEKFRTLKMYHQSVEQEKLEDAFSLTDKWNELVQEAMRKDNKLNVKKEEFAKVTEEQVAQFKEHIKILYVEYKANGPGAAETSLDKGLEQLQEYKEAVAELNRKKDELVLAEKLFNLKISSFPELVQIEEENKQLSVLYEVYKQVKTSIADWSVMLWVKLDAEVLKTGSDNFEKLKKRLGKQFENNTVFQKLFKKINDFKDSIPLIQQLKSGSITDRHWEKLMKETGVKFETSIKSMTLEQVFALNLQRFSEKVTEICNAANQEHKNEEEISKIEQAWKVATFKIGKDKKQFLVITTTEDVKQLLEDQLANLQTVASSKYVSAFVQRVRHWEQALNRISEILDVWMIVQKKWQDLEGIFMGSEDIKQQLREDSKKFDQNDKAYKKIMEMVGKNPNIYNACVVNEGRLGELKALSDQLDKRQKSLSDYLDTKRNVFPRFYFLSDDDLLSILGSSDVNAVQPHTLKLFDNCREMLLSRNKMVIGMLSDEAEDFAYREPQKTDGPVELWMTKVDLEMQDTLKKMTKEAVFHYANKERIPWIQQQIGMISIAGTQVWWTWRVEDVFRKVKGGNKYAMKDELKKQTKDLDDLIDIIRTDLRMIDRMKINTLIIVDVHARDIVDFFVKDSILDAKEFEWESQLRFYWTIEENDIRIRQCTGVFTYGYEYQGLNGRLVITPLTDRCVMTLTTALTFKLGGAPAGPAGTGKTETVKDLAKSLAIRCCVTNCGEGLDYKAMGVIFSGLVQTGFWGCFDEFNRITPEVLSVVSVQIKSIQQALIQEKKTIELLKKELQVRVTVGIFVTMNPGYAGRSELPDNLKALFRPVVMVVPDSNIICEIMLMSQGFNSARVLAKKMTVLYKLGQEQLSKQYHYDFGLRALKSVLVMAGALKREAADLPEELTLMRALRDMNMPKFIFEDVPLFTGLITDLFPKMDVKRKPYEKKDKIQECVEALGLKSIDDQIDKVVQLFETMLTRHTTMVVGPTGSGKSAVIEILKKVETATYYCLNPKAITVNELYGVMEMTTREWKDGLLSKIFRVANEKPPGVTEVNQRWILLDGDVDAVWVENMNSVMDDNKLLTLINGDRIRLERYCKLLFEVFDLQYASPATISRCGMVYVDPKNLGYRPYFEKWMNKWLRQKEKFESLINSLEEYYQKYIPVMMNLIFDGLDGEEVGHVLEFTLPRTNLNVIVQLTKMLDTILNEDEPIQDADQLEFIFIFAIVWSLGACLKIEARKKFEEVLRRTSGRHLPPNSLFDSLYDYQSDSKTWVTWEKKAMEIEYKPPMDGKFNKILVPTADTKRFSFLLATNIALRIPVMFVGDSGTAKSVIIINYLNSLPAEGFMKVNINFSSRTKSMDVQTSLDENIDKRSGRIFGPKISGKKLIIFIDDIHMPKIDIYGTQQPIAWLKFLIEKGYIYERSGNLDQKVIKDTQFVSAVQPPGGGANPIDPRFLSLFNCFQLVFPSNENLERIYNSILRAHITGFPEEVSSSVGKITQATLQLYGTIIAQLPRTPLKFHYIFNLRDLSRIYEGLLRSTLDKFQTKESFVKLWRNEVTRVFVDRLITNEDRDLITVQLIPKLVQDHFADTAEQVLQDPLLFGDYMTANPLDQDVVDPRLYEDCVGYDKVGDKFNQLLSDYNEDNKEMNLVLFKDALEHLTKIHRIIRFPMGHALLVGYGGSGKQSLTRLSAFTAQYDIFQIQLTRGYKEKEFREDLKKLYDLFIIKPTIFLFTDAHVIEESFLELINNMLTIGMVPGLLDEEGKKQATEKIRDEAKRKGIAETKDELWMYFIEKVRENMHIVLAMSPAGDTLRIRCRNFPGLVSNSQINWFFPWPEEALISVAQFFLAEENLEEETFRPLIINHIVMVHTSVQQYSKDFESQLKRRNFSTPKNYLDFLQNYQRLLAVNRKNYQDMIIRYTNGVQKLDEASIQVKTLQEELEIKKAEVTNESQEVAALLEIITEKKGIAESSAKDASIKKKQLDIDTVEIDKQQKEADQILQESIPLLEQAKEALGNIDQKELVELKALPNPPRPVGAVAEMLLLFRPMDGGDPGSGWNAAKVMMAVPIKLLDALKNYGGKISKVTRGQIEKIRAIDRDPENRLNEIEKVSKAAFGLYRWVSATQNLYEVNRKVEPLKQKVETMTAQATKTKADLMKTEQQLEQLTKDVGELQIQSDQKGARLAELRANAQMMELKLNAANKLIAGLSNEKRRWTSDTIKLKEMTVQLIGDCLVASSFLSYVGPFDFSFRKKMIFDHWILDLKEKALPINPEFKLEELLSSAVDISQWNSEGLPSDELSVQNGILTTKSSRWPLCIDPQLQAVTWIKKREEKDSGFKVLNLNEGSGVFLKPLENCIRFGKACLFENVDEELDPTLDPILEKNFIVRAGIKSIRLSENVIDYNDDFKLYFTTKLGNPKYTPEIMSKTMVINYTVTLTGLRDQLLNVVVAFERPDKEKQRLELIQSMSENRKKLKEAEDDLLQKLAEAKGSLLDNVQLIQTLDQTKAKSEEIQQAIKDGEITSQEIEQARQSYSNVAKRGAILFFAMTSLSSISEMYEFSLSSYLSVFNIALRDARKDSILESRLRNITDKLTNNVYDYTCLGIFEIHKLMFALQMTIMIQDGEKLINHTELDFFLKGNTSLEQIQQQRPYDWVPDQGWKDIQRLATIGDIFANIINDLEKRGPAWKKWYDQEKPESDPLPEGYSKLNAFQRLLVLRVFRPDRVINGVKIYIQETYGNSNYVQPPIINYEKILEQSNERSPIVFILSPGADPLPDVIKLGDAKGFTGAKFKSLSLGQGSETEASQYVEAASQRGLWLMLANCHLLTGWLKSYLEKALEQMQKPHKDFRLWLTTQPTDSFPLGILQKSLKVVTEPPDGLKLNMKAIMSKIDENQLNSQAHFAYKSLIYVICFFHSIILDRRKYGKIGWNVTYDFNESDFNISSQLLGMYLKKAYDAKDDAIPWNSLKYLIGEAMYGGRVTDSYDRRVLITYLDEYMGDFLFDKNRPFSFKETDDFNYALPVLNYEGFLTMIDSLPIINSPVVFGLHPNAEITYFTNSAKQLWDNLLLLQSSGTQAVGGIDKDSYVNHVADDVMSKMPPVWDVIALRKEAGEAITPTQVVLFQEIERFNKLIVKIGESLFSLKRALKGEIGMSSDLDELSVSLFNGFLPAMWRRLAPQTEKKLGAWMLHFLHRVSQYKGWVKQEPIVMWLSGLHIPESYLTALIQTTCRSKGWALDKSRLYTIVTKNREESAIKKKPEHGCFIVGLYLEGARWDMDKDCLQRQLSKELIYEMPLIQIIPVEVNKLKLKDTLVTPVYVTQNRRNPMGTGLVFEADLRTSEHVSHWVLQGVALTLNVDY